MKERLRTGRVGTVGPPVVLERERPLAHSRLSLSTVGDAREMLGLVTTHTECCRFRCACVFRPLGAAGLRIQPRELWRQQFVLQLLRRRHTPQPGTR